MAGLKNPYTNPHHYQGLYKENVAKDVTFEPSSAIFFCRVGSTFPVLLFLLFTEIEFSRVIDLAFSEK